MERITVNYDDGPEAALEIAQDILGSLNIPYEVVYDDTRVHIEYEIPITKAET